MNCLFCKSELKTEHTPPPKKARNFAFEFIKKLVIAWDPDFTKVTQKEYDEIIAAEKEIENGDFVRHEDIDW